MIFTDEHQQRIVELHNVSALVLAAPGCGKTTILARRIHYAAINYGIPFDKMLCITFTNRAAREMKERIERDFGTTPQGLFVGNIHRFCLRFLHENKIIRDEVSVLDEEDCNDFLCNTLGIDHYEVKEFLKKSAALYQTENDHPASLTMRPSTPFTPADYERLEAYARFKEDNLLIDFDEILLRTYTALLNVNAGDYAYTDFQWMQVDEVQDMTPLQLAILDRLTRRVNRTVVYFGDEQQAIFSFTGAGGRALERLKQLCSGNILRMQRNYRSPRHLVELCNDMASKWLDIGPEFLPQAMDSTYLPENLRLYEVPDSSLPVMAAWQVKKWHTEFPGESITVLVRTNAEGSIVSNFFAQQGIEHFHIAKNDIFHSIPFKTIWSHLSAILVPTKFHPWARLLYQTKCVHTLSGARKLVNMLRRNAVSCVELLDLDNKGDVEFFSETINKPDQTIVVIDTETTGLDVFNDDVIQIAAVKVRNGKIVPGSEFEVFIESDRKLPLELRDGLPNPMVDIYYKAEKTSATAALSSFAEYCGNDSIIAGHNLEFDINILRANFKRRTPFPLPQALGEGVRSIDTLQLSRLLFPRHRSHTLEFMLKSLALEGVNSHNAADDVAATANLLTALNAPALDKLPEINALKADRRIIRTAKTFAERYGSFYRYWRTMINSPQISQHNTLSGAITVANSFFSKAGYMDEMPREDYVLKLFEELVIDPADTTLRAQLGRHLYELTSFNEADLFTNNIVKEKISILTVHKAKGLEMDNVLMYNACRTIYRDSDHTRLLYVAFSRAKKRLSVGMHGRIPPVMRTTATFFCRMTPGEVREAIKNTL